MSFYGCLSSCVSILPFSAGLMCINWSCSQIVLLVSHTWLMKITPLVLLSTTSRKLIYDLNLV